MEFRGRYCGGGGGCLKDVPLWEATRTLSRCTHCRAHVCGLPVTPRPFPGHPRLEPGLQLPGTGGGDGVRAEGPVVAAPPATAPQGLLNHAGGSFPPHGGPRDTAPRVPRCSPHGRPSQADHTGVKSRCVHPGSSPSRRTPLWQDWLMTTPHPGILPRLYSTRQQNPGQGFKRPLAFQPLRKRSIEKVRSGPGALRLQRRRPGLAALHSRGSPSLRFFGTNLGSIR